MIMGGPILFFDENAFLGYQGWEEFHRDQQEHSAQSCWAEEGSIEKGRCSCV